MSDVPPGRAVSIIKAAAVHVEHAFVRDEQETQSLFSRTPRRRAEIATGVLWDLGWRPPYLDGLPEETADLYALGVCTDNPPSD